jgi:hypothetical protein
VNLRQGLNPDLLFLTALQQQPAVEHGASWDKVCDLASRHQLETWLNPHVARANDAGVRSKCMEQLSISSRGAAQHNLQLAGEMLRLVARFSDSGVRAVPFKGPCLEALVHGKLGCRPMQDLDFFLPRAHLAKACEILRADGYLPALDLPADRVESYSRQLSQIPFQRPRGGAAVDLHHELMPRAFHFPLAFESVASRLAPVAVCGRQVQTLDRTDLLLVLCAHHAKHGWDHLRWLYEIVALIAKRPELDWDVVFQRAAELRALRLLSLGLYLGFEVLRCPLPNDVLTRIRSDPVVVKLAQEVVRQWAGPSRGPRSGIRLFRFHVMMREHIPDGIRYANALMFAPTPADWKSLPLPQALSFLYYPWRQLRLLWKYAIRAVGFRSGGPRTRRS